MKCQEFCFASMEIKHFSLPKMVGHFKNPFSPSPVNFLLKRIHCIQLAFAYFFFSDFHFSLSSLFIENISHSSIYVRCKQRAVARGGKPR